jgi:hypothetical protein
MYKIYSGARIARQLPTYVPCLLNRPKNSIIIYLCLPAYLNPCAEILSQYTPTITWKATSTLDMRVRDGPGALKYSPMQQL